MLQGLDISQRIEFSLSSDTTEPKTVFTLRPLTGPERFEISSRFVKFTTKNDGGQSAELQITSEYALCILKKCVVSISNFAENTTIENAINKLSPLDIAELLTKCMSISSLTEQERKN